MTRDIKTEAQKATIEELNISDLSLIISCEKCSGSGESIPDIQCKSCEGTGIKNYYELKAQHDLISKIKQKEKQIDAQMKYHMVSNTDELKIS